MTFKCGTFFFLVVFVILHNVFTLHTFGYQDFRFNEKLLGRSTYRAYWNVPTFQCASKQVNFTSLAEKYKIYQNDGDKFRGNVMAILYDPGAFPAILKSTSKLVLRNGGVPQEGNLTLHLQYFKDKMDEQIPDKDFAGVGIIDFESWRPVFRQNFGTLKPYKDFSIEIEKQLHPLWPNNFLEKEAQRRFEYYGRMFMEETLIYAQQLRPKASWGYYAYPYCFNMNPNTLHTECPTDVKKENDMIEWLFSESDTLNPSLYLREKNLNVKQRQQLITGRINEAHRIIGYLSKAQDPLIMPYFWYKYQDTNMFLTKEDMYDSLHNLKKLNIDGLIIWGSSNDVNTKKKCEDLYNYVDTVLGPALNTVYR